MSRLAERTENVPEEWTKFKDVIHDLYITQGLKLQGAGGLIELMKSRHSFTRTKSQYTSQLAKWKFKKYSGGEKRDWQIASFKVSKATKHGNKAQLYHEGHLVSAKVLRTRGHLNTLEQSNFEASCPQTPPGFAISLQLNRPFTDFWETFTESGPRLSQSLDVVEITNTVLHLSKSALYQNFSSLMLEYLPVSINCPITMIPDNGVQKIQVENWIKFIAFMLSNNHSTYLDPEDRKKMLRILKRMNAPTILNSAAVLKEPSSKALLESIFRLAIETEDLEVVRSLLKNQMNPNGHCCHAPDRKVAYFKGWGGGVGEMTLSSPDSLVTPLQFALLVGNLQMAKLFIDHNANLDEPHNGWKSSAIALAIFGWSERLEPRIMDQERNDSSQKQKDTVTITNFVKDLIDQGAKVNTDDLDIETCNYSHQFYSGRELMADKQSPLTIASIYQLEGLRLFGDNFETLITKMREESQGLIHMATIHHNTPLVKYFVDAGLDINEVVQHDWGPETALCAAIKNGDEEIIHLLVEADAKFEIEAGRCICGHVRYINILVVAAQFKNADLVCNLVARGANLNAYGLVLHVDHCMSHGKTIVDQSRLSGLGGAPCDCECITPLGASLLNDVDLPFLLTLLGLGANSNLSEEVEGYSNHLTPLTVLFLNSDVLSEFKVLALQALLDAGANPLHAVALMSYQPHVLDTNFESLRILLGRVAFQSTPDTTPSIAGTAALIQAIRLMDLVLIEALLDREIAIIPTERLDIYPSPMQVAISRSFSLLDWRSPDLHYDMLLLLFKAGYSPHGSLRGWPEDQKCVVHQAVRLGDNRVLTLLRQLDVKPLDPHFKCFSTFSNSESTISVSVRYLYGGRGKMLYTDMNTELQVNAFWGRHDVVEFLILQGADVNAAGEAERGATALQLALLKGHLDTARLLIGNGADVNAPPSSFGGTTSLQMAASDGHLDMVKLLVESDADVNGAPHLEVQRGPTALQHAAIRGSLDMVKYLVEKGADVNPAFHFERQHYLFQSPRPQVKGLDLLPESYNVLQYAAMEGSFDVVKYLVENGADVNGSPHHQKQLCYTALQHAVMRGSFDMIKYLIEKGADVNAPPAAEGGATALQCAAKLGLFTIAEFLIRHDADINAQPAKYGRTALEGAAKNGRIDMVQLLLDHGAGRGDENQQSVESACEMAETSGHFAIRGLIKKWFKELVND
ncbi:hypothetical protein G7Z17_g2129 [Cylindrodendrum hubeiense]|uniref:Clr5 domain-containing protein n=1 Tax=Cylindrodendrum hubeiense TaxID=595255 RepID=A0A9P5LBW6_9HYPO|nr:hypothetical protein G7Z17_g2129 [Cylindrodendrum hubeiense]